LKDLLLVVVEKNVTQSVALIMPANLPESTRNTIVNVIAFTSLVLICSSIWSACVHIPWLRRRRQLIDKTMLRIEWQMTLRSLLLGITVSVGILSTLSIVLTLPLIQETLPEEEVGHLIRQITSSINFCEEDFHNSRWIAEPANVGSSLGSFVPLAIAGLWTSSHLWRISNHSGVHFIIAWCSLMAIGLGSAALHSSLTSWTQGGDELPMLWYTACTSYSGLNIIFRGSYSKILAVTVTTAVAIATFVYVQNRNDFAIFYIMFSCFSQCTLYCIIYLTLLYDWSSHHPYHGAPGVLSQINVIIPLSIVSSMVTLLAIWVWASEMLFCATMTETAHGQVPLWGDSGRFVWNRIIHPLWHIFSGLVAWIVVQYFIAAHGMQSGWGTPTIKWFLAPYVAFLPRFDKIEKVK
jgi:hypothetical protein